MQRYQHTSSYLAVPYEVTDSGGFFSKFKLKDPPMQVDIEKLLSVSTESVQKHMAIYEQDGYELMTVQPLLKALEYPTRSQNIAGVTVYNLTQGLMFFWKRKAFRQGLMS